MPDACRTSSIRSVRSSPFAAACFASCSASRRSDAICFHVVADPSPCTSPPSTYTKYGAAGTRCASQAAVDLTSGTSSRPSRSSFDGLSWLVSFVTTTRRMSRSRCSAWRPRRMSSQKFPHTAQPLVRKATSVGGAAAPRLTFTASPSSVVPAMSAGARVVTTAGGSGRRDSDSFDSAPGGPSRRRISAWLRNSPATSSTSRASRTVSTATRTSTALDPAGARQLLDLGLLEAACLVAAHGVVDLQRPVAVERRDRRRVLARDHPAGDLGRAAHLRVALAVAEVVAVDAALAAGVPRAVAAAREVLTGLAVAVHVVAHVLLRAEAFASVRRALPPTGRVGVRRAGVLAVAQLAAERRVAIRAKAARAVARPDDGPGRGRVQQVAQRPDRQRGADERRARDQAAPRRSSLERRAGALHEPLGHDAGPLLYDCHARGNTVKARKDA